MSRNRADFATAGRGCSLTRAIGHVLRQAGGDTDHDDVHVGLGLGLLICSVPDEPDLPAWPAYARDAFLVSGARLFGLTVRDLHPPDAARGLVDAAEYQQHFDASYRPLVARALENGQPVLAWRGWGEAHELDWGIIHDVCDAGVGFRGIVFGGEGSAAHVERTLVAPPPQIYVVESTRPGDTARDDLLDAIVAHATASLDGSLDDVFDVVTGASALGEWAGLLSEIPSDVSAFVTSHVGLAQAYLAGLRALESVLLRMMVDCRDTPGRRVGAVRACVETLIERLSPLADAEIVGAAVMAPGDLVELRDRIIAGKRGLESLAAVL